MRIQMPQANTMQAAQGFIEFVNSSPSPFHAVATAIKRLETKGFQKLREQDAWDLRAGGKYYVSRNQVALLAFALPSNWKSGAGVSIVATHIDSPNLRVRPVSKKSTLGYLQVGVETYGSGLWHTWLDRDLAVAGRVVVTNKAGTEFTSKLVKVDKPILRVPNLAIHLSRGVNDKFEFNKQTEFIPILGTAADQLNAPKESPTTNHHPAFLAAIADQLSVAPELISDMELSLYDAQPSVIGGINNDFIFSARLDNQLSSYCAVEALATSSHTSSENVNCIALFNHEEVGSGSTSGAAGSLIPYLLQRLSPLAEDHARSIAKSFLISADVTHAVHPSYPSKHEESHSPRINNGIAIKLNNNQKYASDALSSFFIRKLVEKKGGKVQEFASRNDMPCGSTVGPILSQIGLRTVDVGNPILSMHSCREMAGTQDVQSCIDLFTSLFEEFSALDKQLTLV